jgi:Fur family peroxide stress response transcriptional regulator
LVEEGKIRMLLLGERMARYDPMLAAHDHFICQHCGRVEDLLVERGHQVNLRPLIERGFTVFTHSLAIHGLCQQCGQAQEKKSRTNRVPGSVTSKAGTAELQEKDIRYQP